MISLFILIAHYFIFVFIMLVITIFFSFIFILIITNYRWKIIHFENYLEMYSIKCLNFLNLIFYFFFIYFSRS